MTIFGEIVLLYGTLLHKMYAVHKTLQSDDRNCLMKNCEIDTSYSYDIDIRICATIDAKLIDLPFELPLNNSEFRELSSCIHDFVYCTFCFCQK